ncbi:MAG: TonB-dependent receptor plug domain-containing protein [Holophagaceae bacterium]|jgi:outer membrane cobalamin receptor|uniref:TonB-dependent receptor plug domain-containing protein n=1 Tax=Candidatus Geothrix odensensis TaxID=2954440 RepID=A0A936K5X0_9BACT|nr:TonB-dependent receptor plug domain-containing protein [Candidatus Geothrix odensensis]
MTVLTAATAGARLLLPALCLTLAAQDQAPPVDPDARKPLESWAAESLPVALSRTPAQVRVFDEDDIQRSGARTLGQFLLRELPSQVQNQGGPGLPSRSYLGGGRPQDTVVMVDGVPRMDPGRLGQNLNEVPLLGITRIEVITGSPGSAGQGGTIALFTGRPDKPGLSGDLGGLGGSNGQGQSTASPGFAWEGGYLSGGNLSAQEKQTTETDRPFRMVTNFVGLGQKWGSTHWTLAWRGTFFGVPEPYQEVTETTRVYDAARESRQRSDAGHLRVDWDLAPGLRLETTLGLARFRHEQAPQGASRPSPFEGRETRFQSALHWATGARSDLSLCLEGQEVRQVGDENPLVQGSANGRRLGLGVEWRFEPRPGLRLLGTARGTRERQSLLIGGVDTEVLNASGHTLRLGLNQELAYGLRLYSALGGGRTAPTVLQQLRNSLVPTAAPLRMEQSTFVQIGLGWGQGNWYGRLESQQQTGKDLLAFDGQSYANQDRVRVRGTEAAFGWRTAQQVGLEGFVRAQEARDLNAPEGQALSTLASQRRPFSSHGLKGFMGWSRVRAEIHYTLQGHQYAAAGDSEGGGTRANGLPPTIRATQVVYRDVGLSTTVKAGRHWTLVIRGEHLLQPRTDAAAWVARAREGQNDASIIDGYPAAGPSYSVEARFRF